jgi:hypothetical protein
MSAESSPLCAWCERVARYAVLSLGTVEDLRTGWESELVLEGPDDIELMAMPYCTKHAGSALQWAHSTQGYLNGCDVLSGPIEELDEVLREAAEQFAADDGYRVHGPWVLEHVS